MEDKRLRFMWKKLPLPRICMAEWFRVDSFEEAMLEKVSRGEEISTATVLPVMEEIFDCIVNGQIDVGDSVRIDVLRRGINRLRSAYSQMSTNQD